MNDAIDTVERLLCERYNVASLDGLGSLPGAIESARSGDLTPLRAALAGRELYRWERPIEEALALAARVDEPTEAGDAEPEEPLTVETAADDGVQVEPEGSDETEADAPPATKRSRRPA